MIRQGEHGTRIHPTQKPLKLMSYCMNLFKGKNVWDPYLGSGSTLIAAEEISRTCFGSELEPKYCELIITRYKKYCMRKEKEFKCLINGAPLCGTYLTEQNAKSQQT